MKIETYLSKIKRLAKHRQCSLEQTMMYLMEEVGEISLAITVKNGFKKRNLKDSIPEECIDAMICVLAVYYESGGTNELMLQCLKRKLKKWERNMK